MRAGLILAAVLFSATLHAQSGQAAEAAEKNASPQSNTGSGANTELAPATRSGPRVAPENERPIARTPRTPRSTLPASDCVGAVNTTDCLSKSAPPKSKNEEILRRSDKEVPSNSDSGDLLPGDALGDLSPPRSSDGVSSSRDTQFGAGGIGAAADVNEMHPFDPHKAAKDVEVGEFYLKRRNYKAAISRFLGALRSKPNDALATFRLAEALEGDKQFAEAAKNYSLYLDILPTGDNAAAAREALDRLENAGQASLPAR